MSLYSSTMALLHIYIIINKILAIVHYHMIQVHQLVIIKGITKEVHAPTAFNYYYNNIIHFQY